MFVESNIESLAPAGRGLLTPWPKGEAMSLQLNGERLSPAMMHFFPIFLNFFSLLKPLELGTSSNVCIYIFLSYLFGTFAN